MPSGRTNTHAHTLLCQMATHATQRSPFPFFSFLSFFISQTSVLVSVSAAWLQEEFSRPGSPAFVCTSTGGHVIFMPCMSLAGERRPTVNI